jgi:hypothetical protein
MLFRKPHLGKPVLEPLVMIFGDEIRIKSRVTCCETKNGAMSVQVVV